MAKEYKNYIAQKIDSELAKTYKKKELEFDYIPVKKFKEIEEETNPLVIGSIKLKTTNKTKADTLTIYSNDRSYVYEIVDENEEPDDKDERKNKRKTMGFIKVDENTYISLIKDDFLFILLFAGLALGISFIILLIVITQGGPIDKPGPDGPDGPGISQNTQSSSLEIESGEDITSETREDEDDVIKENITIPGYANLYVSKKNPTISLINPEGNSVYMKYTIKNGDKVIYETKALEPNKMIKANLKEVLPNGQYELLFIIETYDLKTQAGCNGAKQEVKLLVKD